VAAALFLPAFFLDLPLLCASLAIAFAALVAAEVARCTGLPVVGAAVQGFMQVGGRGECGCQMVLGRQCWAAYKPRLVW
jgi:hypothetical protein